MSFYVRRLSCKLGTTIEKERRQTMEHFVLSTEIISGEDSLEYLKSLKAKKLCIVTDKIMLQIGAVQRITDILEAMNVTYKIFDSVEANPSLETVYKGLYYIMENRPGALIAIGGGSVIDAAKAMIYFCIKTKEMLIDKARIDKPKFIAIPTTSGTGSEVTSYSVITDNTYRRKVPLSDKVMLPDVALLNPTLTISVPKNVTADTGMDVITHALEAYVSTQRTLLSTMYAEKALKIAFETLLKVYNDGQNINVRGRMHEASCMAGVSFTNAGLGINHSLAHTLGAHFQLSHGRANAILLPKVIAYNSGLMDGTLDVYGEIYEEIATSIGIHATNLEESIQAFVVLLERFNEMLEIPLKLRDMGIERDTYFEAVPQMAQDALKDMCTQSNPRKVTIEILTKLLELIY